MQFLLAVDMGIKTGLALYGNDGALRWYRSQNFGNAARLRRGAKSALFELEDLSWVVIEGGGPLADIWQNEAQRRQIQTVQISAETWRQQLLYARDQRNGAVAKQKANQLARQVIDWSGARRPTSLRHDAAEAILNNRSSRKIAPARLADAEDHLILAIRERAAGLCADSEENTFAVSNALGPVPNHRQPIEQLENAGPCDAYAGDQQ